MTSLPAALSLTLVGTAAAIGTLSSAKGRGSCLSNDKAHLGSCQYGRGVGGAPSVMSPDGKNLYVVDYPGDSVAVMRRNPATGALRQQGGSKGCLVTKPGPNHCGRARGIEEATGIAVSPDGKNVYVYTDEKRLLTFDRDPGTGTLVERQGAAGCISSGARGGCTEARGLAAVTADISVVVSPDGGNVYVGNSGPESVVVFDRDPATGVLRRQPGSGGCVMRDRAHAGCVRASTSRTFQVEVRPDGRNVYAVGLFPATVVTLLRATS